MKKDKGGYDVVTRATTNHGLHRGSFQGNAVIEAKASMIPQKNFLFLTGVKMVKNSINHPQMLQV